MPEGTYRQESHFDGRVVVCLSDRPATLNAMIARSVERHGSNEALVCGSFRCNWAELASLTEAFASGFLARGIAAGDRVVLFLGNRPEFVLALYALSRIGAIAVPVGIREQAPGLAYIAEQSRAKAILHEVELAPRIPPLPLQLAIGDRDTRQFINTFADPSITLPPDTAGEEDAALIMYTSGTTGKPKGAVITHLGLVHIGAGYAGCMDLGAHDRSVCVVPLSHITGITATLCPMAFAGGCAIIVPEFKAEQFVTLAQRERMTHTLMVPAMYNLLLARTDLAAADLAAWRIGGFGGAPMPVPTIESLERLLPNLRLMNCYGATETCGAAAVMPAQWTRKYPDSAGLALPFAEIRIMTPDGQPAGPGEIGELWIRGPTVTPGYWRNPEATELGFTDGFWRSGDIGSVDAEGFVRVLDRLKDMINRGGYKIFTAEVESVLTSHPAILEAAVIARPCPVLGERVHAFITLSENGEEIDAAAISVFCATRMTDYKQPETFTIGRDPLPRNANGKVLKADLRARLAQ